MNTPSMTREFRIIPVVFMLQALIACGGGGSGSGGTGGSTTTAVWTSVSVGDSHTLAIKTDGTLWSWGANNSGQLGAGSNASSNTNTPVQIGVATNWARIYAGYRHPVGVEPVPGALTGVRQKQHTTSDRRIIYADT